MKRNATTAIKKRITIQGAADFYRWGVTQTASLVKYTFLDEQEVEQAAVELDAMKAVAVKGTIKIHSVTSVREGQVYVRNISCMKPCCFTVDGKFVPSCAGWTMHKTCLQEEDQLHQDELHSDKDATVVQPSRGDHVEVRLARHTYIANVALFIKNIIIKKQYPQSG